jgi:hypothetical protein
MARGDAVIANSEFTAAHVRATYPDAASRIVAIPRGVDLTRFSRRDPDRAQGRAGQGLAARSCHHRNADLFLAA